MPSMSIIQNVPAQSKRIIYIYIYMQKLTAFGNALNVHCGSAYSGESDPQKVLLKAFWEFLVIMKNLLPCELFEIKPIAHWRSIPKSSKLHCLALNLYAVILHQNTRFADRSGEIDSLLSLVFADH